MRGFSNASAFSLRIILLITLGFHIGLSKICVIPAAIQPGKSTVNLKGDSPLGGLDPAQDPANLGGSIYFVLPTANCPTTADGLAKQLAGAKIAAPTAAPAVVLSENELKARYKKLGITAAVITMTGFQLQFSANNLTVDADGKFLAPIRAIGAAGKLQLEVLNQDAVTKPLAASDVIAINPASVVVTATGLTVEIPDLELQYAYPPNSKAVLTGTVYAEAAFADAKVYNNTDFSPGVLPVVLAPPPPPLKAPAGADIVCVVPMALDSTQCPVDIGGKVTAEGLGTFGLSQPGKATLVGFVYAVFPLCKCPTTQAAWAAALPAALFYNPLDQPGISTDPTTIKTEIQGGLATVNFNNIQMVVETKVALSLNTTASYNAAVVYKILQGMVVPSMGSSPRPLADESLTPKSTGLLTLEDGALSLNYPDIQLPVKDPGSADLTIKTAMVAKGLLSTAFPSLATNFNASIKATDGPCGVMAFPPPVKRSPPPASPPPAVTPQSPPPENIVIGSSTGGPSGVGPAYSSNGNCPDRMGPVDGTCGCTDGWYGGDCVTCQTNEACSDWLDPTTSTCNTSFVFSPITVYKAYTCSFTDAVIADFITSASFICNVRGEKLRFENSTLGLMEGGVLGSSEQSATGSKGICRMVATMKDQVDNPLVCTGTDCTFDDGAATGKCKKVSCYCPAKCPEVVGNIFTKITSISLQCPNTGGSCKLVADGLPLTPGMNCRVGECTLPDTKAEDLKAEISSETRDWIPIIASTPLWALSFIALACGVYIGIHNNLFALPDMRSALMNGTEKNAAAFAPGSPLGESVESGADLLVRGQYQSSSMRHAPQQRGPAGAGPVAEATDAMGEAQGGYSYEYRGYPGYTQPATSSPGFGGENMTGKVFDEEYTDTTYGYNQGNDQQLMTGGAAGVLIFSNVRCTVWDESHGLGQRVKACFGGKSKAKPSYVGSPGEEHVAAIRTNRDKRTKVLLDNVSGRAVEGQVTAVMGPSGSGKTTLLGVLSSTFQGLSDSTHISGTVSLCDETRRNVLSSVTAFVPQKDVLLPALTVAESLQYSALLRLPHRLTADEIRERIAGVLVELGLARVANSKVGGSSSIRGVSGGERRRVTIGMELVTSPRLIIMDEPTSGLDSYTSYNLLVTCKQVARRGRIVVMSVHQPSPTMFYEFDACMFLSRGHVLYSGTPANLEQYLDQAGYPMPRHTPIADHMLNLISEDGSLATLMSYRAQLTPSARSHGYADAEYGHGQQGVNGGVGPNDVDAHHTAQQAKARSRMMPEEESGCWLDVVGFTREVAVLFRRSFIQLVRTPSMLTLHAATSIIMGLLVGAVFFKLSFDTAGAQNRAGFLFFSLCMFGFTSLTIIDSLALERELVVREVKSKYYNISSYLVTKIVLDGLLLRFIPALIYALLTQFLVGLNSAFSKAATFFFLLATFSCTVGTLALSMSAIFPQTSDALLVMNVILLLWVLMGGFLVNGGGIPLFLRWIRYVSPMSYAFEGMVTNEIRGQKFELALEGVGSIKNVDGIMLVKLIGLNPYRLGLDVTATIVAYLFALGLAFLCYAVAVLPFKRWLLSFYPPPADDKEKEGSH